MNILFQLLISSNVDAEDKTMSHGENRILQYVTGLLALFKYGEKLQNKNVKIYLRDNTIQKGRVINKKILAVVPDYVNITTCFKNFYGSKNKGAGMINQWKNYKNEISCHDWHIHYEPRQLLLNFDFFESFLERPRNLFYIHNKENNPHFWTGLFAIRTTDFLPFLKSVDLDIMVSRKISLEYLFYNYMIENNIKFDTVDKLNLMWNDAAKDRWVNV